MKKYVASALVLLLVSGVVIADGLSVRVNDVLRIETGSESSGRASNRELEDRIHRLERAVAQLQNEVFRLTDMPPQRAAAAAPKRVSCYLKTTFKTHTADGASKNEARGKVLKECEKNGGIFCEEDSIKCDD